MKIYHNSRESEYRTPFGAVEVLTDVRLSIRIECEDPSEHVEGVQLRCRQEGVDEFIQDMDFSCTEEEWKAGTVRYATEVRVPSEGTLLWYYFIIRCHGNDGEYYLYYGNNDRKSGGEGVMKTSEPEPFQITVYKPVPVPEWYKESIVYQIFPDRFARDDKWESRCETVCLREAGRKGQKKTVEEDWYRPAYYEKDGEGNVISWPFYGGSLKGIEDKLDYLTSLGVSAIYLNPIFEAVSNHRYDTADYTRIDPMLGTEEDFRDLAKAAKAKGINIILDGVFSHTGADSIYFDKYGNFGGNGAFGNEESPYRSWYEFREDDPVGYRSWWGIRDLPEVNETEDSFVDLICGEEGVLAKWLRAGAKGFRLDVADELPDEFIADIRRRLKNEGMDNLLLGEVWEDASNKISYGRRRKYFMGEELDATMNYPLRDLLIDFAGYRKNAHEVSEGIMSLQENYPMENFYGALNLIGSHDRRRILTEMKADENYDEAVERVKMLTVLQYALPGVPCIYYGDEAAMTGESDPANRSGFIWGRENADLQFHYRELGVIYREHPVLKSGGLKVINTGNDNVLGFIRYDQNEAVAVFANRGWERTEIQPELLGAAYAGYALELLTSRELETAEGSLSRPVEIKARSAVMICLVHKKIFDYQPDRSAGVICHISSIPGGKLGAPARDFVDYLESAGMTLWQVLPLNPPGLGNSPYSSNAAFAGNPDFINYDEVPSVVNYNEFYSRNSFWLEEYIDYLDSQESLEDKDKDRIRRQQYYFSEQWKQLKEYANSKGVKIIGDLPVFVSAYSADVRGNRNNYQIDELGIRKNHAGVPPDYFSPEGQDWGNPLYDWDYLKETGYDWWIKRLKQCGERYDYVRLDHFRSFSEYYAIPEGKPAGEGTWQKGPGIDFFRTVAEELGGTDGVKIIAEDLGSLDCGVYNLLKLTGLPGMNVWQFSADEIRRMTPEEIAGRILYTGTHDNQTLMGWCRDNNMSAGDALAIIKEMYESRAPWVLLQIQDMFMLGDEARMNVPGQATGNWQWRIPGKTITEGMPDAETIAKAYRKLAESTGRRRPR